ncbi:MAG: signal peptidase I [Thermoleophilia bacterium]|nr:signal peptidase I [Thermoleophilia bacterium]
MSEGSEEQRAAQGKGPRVETADKKGGLWRTVIEVVVIVAAAFVIALLVQAFLIKPFTIHQVSMRPTLEDGDRVLINRLSYHFRDPERGDVVIFHSPMVDGEDLVKRVIAVPGDRVAVRDGALWLNGVAQEEPYLLEQDFAGVYPDDGEDELIQEGEVFVMGDNRNNSGDSRFFGPIDANLIMGCAFAVYWPIGHWRGL